MKKLLSYIVLPLIMLTFFIAYHIKPVHALEIKAEINPAQIQLESYGQLQITVTGSRKADVSVPKIDGLVFKSSGTMQSMQVINGDTTISYTANYIVFPQREGRFTIAPITATVKGDTVTAEPIEVEAIPAGSRGTGNKTLSTEDTKTEDELAFLRFIPEKNRLYVGEKVFFQLKAYFKRDASELTLPVLDGDGFIISPFSKNPQQNQEVYNGKTYTVLTWNNTLSGVKSGTFPLRFNLDGTILLPRQQTSSDPFGSIDPFFDNFFSHRYQKVPVQLKSEPANLTVVPLPMDNQPDNFSGAVGQFSLLASASPINVTTGEPVTLRLTVKGNGNFDRVQCPDFPDTENFKVYQVNEDTTTDRRVKYFERAVVPKTVDANTIPSHSLTYFDPVQEQYVTTTSAPISLAISAVDERQKSSVAKASTPTVNPQVPQNDTDKQIKPLLFDNLAPQKLDSGSFTKTIKPVHRQLWFLVVFIILALGLVVLSFLVLRKKVSLKNPEMQNKKQNTMLKQQHIQAINDAKKSGDTDTIIQRARTALQHQAGLAAGISSSAVTATSLKQQHHVTQSQIELLQAAENYMFGGVLDGYATIEEFTDKVIEELENKA